MRLIITLLLFFTVVFSIPANARDEEEGAGDSGTGTSAGSPGPCDFGEFLERLGHRESNNNYAAENSLGYLGRWQFGKGALSDIGWYSGGSWSAEANSYGVYSDNDFLNNPAAQDQAMKEWMDKMAYEINYYGLTPYIGTTVGACKVTWSGLLAGRHLCGIGNSSDTSGKCHKGTSLKQYLSSNGSTDGIDGYGTPVSEYVCSFGGLNTPYDYGAKATDCGSIGDFNETGNEYTPTEYTGTPGPGHNPINVETDTTARFYELSAGLKYIWVASFQQMTNQLTTFMMQQVQIIGTFFDAKHQLETQRLMQQKAARAHKDYHPSVQMCEIGTFVRNLTNTERRADMTKMALSESMMDRALATGDAKTMRPAYDQETKKRALLDTFCNKEDNARQNIAICKEDYDPARINADIDFTRTIDMPLTLDINLLDQAASPDEENIFAFLDYIFMHDRFPFMGKDQTTLYGFIGPYQEMRSLIAMRSVAQNSFAEIISQKTAGPDGVSAEGQKESVGPFMKALMREMGMEDADIETTIGKNPSYYAQMEMLTKTIYQHPEFISNLYDKPANVKRIRAALTAIKLMQDRDIHDALMRREMLMSILLELQLRNKQLELENRVLNPVINGPAGQPDDFVIDSAPISPATDSGF